MTRVASLLALFLLLTPPLVVRGEEQGKVYRIGALTAAWGPSPPIVGLRDGLEALGYKENKDFFIGVRFTQGDVTALEEAAGELVGLGIDLLYASSGNGAKAARAATDEIPIICLCDPVKLGLAQSLAHPGGNVTGVTDRDLELAPKRMELLRELVPGLERVLFPYAVADEYSGVVVQAYREAARRLGVQLVEEPLRTQEEARLALQAPQGHDDGILAPLGPPLNIPGFVLEAASRQSIPAMFPGGTFWLERGALMTYGPDWHESGRLAARMVDKIFRGTDPGTIPVETNPRIELGINLKTAKALGLTIPLALLARADEVIE